MAEEDDSRTALIGQKRARNDDVLSVAGSTKRQKRGTEDDAISVGDSSDVEKRDSPNELHPAEISDDEAIAGNDAGNDSERQKQPRFDHQFTPLNGPNGTAHNVVISYEGQTEAQSTEKKSKRARKKEQKERRAANEKQRLLEDDSISASVLSLIEVLAQSSSSGPVSATTDLAIFPDPDLLTPGQPGLRLTTRKLRRAALDYCARYLMDGLIAIGGVSQPKKMKDRPAVRGRSGLIISMKYATQDDLNRAKQICLNKPCVVPDFRPETTAFTPKDKSFRFGIVDLDDLSNGNKLDIQYPLPQKGQAKSAGGERQWFVHCVIAGIKDGSGDMDLARFTERADGTSKTSKKKKGRSPPPSRGNDMALEIAEPVSDDEDHRTSPALQEVNESSSSESGELTDSPSSVDEGGVAVPEPTLPETVQTTSHGDLLPQSGPICLANLTDDERSLQTRYWGISLDEDLVRCPTCSQQGHMTSTCPSRICTHCNFVDDHFSAACPSQQTCTKCRERGHSATSCPSKLTRSAVDGFTCAICAGGHPDEHCSWIWRSFNPALHGDIQKIDHLDILGCYSCGARSHWGDDCPDPLRMKAKPAISCCNTFSSAFANLFTIKQGVIPPPTAPGGKGFSIKGRGGAHPQASRRDLERDREQEEEDEIEEDFLRSRGNVKNNNARNNIKPMTFNIRGSAAGGGGGGGGRQSANEPYAPQQHHQRAPYNDNQNGYRNVPPPQNYNTGQQGYNSGQHNPPYHGGRYAHQAQNKRDLVDRVTGGNTLGGGRGRGGRGGGRGGGGGGGNYRGHPDNRRGGRAEQR